MNRARLAALGALSLALALPVTAQIEPLRPIAHWTVGIYQENPSASWGWERVGSWGWERSVTTGYERVGSWGWERVAASPEAGTLVGLVYVEGSTFGGATQHWAYFDNYDPRYPTELRSAVYDYPDLGSYQGDMAALGRAYVAVPSGSGRCSAEPRCVTLTRGRSEVADAHIRQSEPNKNYGGSQSLTVSGGASGERRALLRFDTSSIPAGAAIESAELSLSGLLYGGSAQVTAVMAPWDEATVTWSSFERAGAQFDVAQGGPHLWRASATIPYTTAGARTTTSLGTLVQGWVDSAIPNNGFIMDKQSADALVVFASSESPDAAQRPALTVCYRACETGCAESCGGNTVCAAGLCRESDAPWADALDACLGGDDACSGHGAFAYGRCFCQPGYTGDDCEIATACPGDCGGHGVCNLGQCFCEPGFEGADCGTRTP